MIPLLSTDAVKPKNAIKHSVSITVRIKRTRYVFVSPAADSNDIIIVMISVRCIPDTAVR